MTRYVIALSLCWAVMYAQQAVAFPNTGVLETFAGTDNTSPPNANWTNVEIRNGAGGCDIEDNAVAPNNTGGYRSCVWNPAQFGPSSEAYATIVNTGSTSFFGVCSNLVNVGTDTTDGYCVEAQDQIGAIGIYRMDNTIATQLGTNYTGFSITVGDKFGISVESGQVCAWFSDNGGAWTEVGCQADSTYTSAGSIGLFIIGNATVGGMDDFGGGTVSAGGSTGGHLRRRHS